MIYSTVVSKTGNCSDFICDFGKLPFSEHLGKYFIKIGKISAKIHEIGKIKAIFGLGMTPTLLTPSFGNCLFANYHVLKHPLTNLILSSFYIPKVLKCAAKIMEIGSKIKF